MNSAMSRMECIWCKTELSEEEVIELHYEGEVYMLCMSCMHSVSNFMTTEPNTIATIEENTSDEFLQKNCSESLTQEVCANDELSNIPSTSCTSTNSKHNIVEDSDKENINPATLPSQLPQESIEKTIIIVKPQPFPKQRNISTNCKPTSNHKSVMTQTMTDNQFTQTDRSGPELSLIPIPVPLYLPFPFPMYKIPSCAPIFLPTPVPFPVVIPTSQKSFEKIMGDIEQMQTEVPNHPYEADLLMIAEALQADMEKEEADDVLMEDETLFTEETVRFQTEHDKTISQNQAIDNNKEYQTEFVNANIYDTLGPIAWEQWLTAKMKSIGISSKETKATKLLSITAKDLNESLCLFIKQVRKPNGAEYAPDTIYLLCLSIQQYLILHGRTDDIFNDQPYEQFTDSLNEISKTYFNLYNNSYFILARVKEEYLWETRQLGAFSPRILLNTLIYFNTKYFGLYTVEEHMQLSFSHFEKWSKSNVEDVFRCPAAIHTVYVSKCPQSVIRSANSNFYLQPIADCTAESTAWYSTTTLSEKLLEKMLNRIKMVKEIAMSYINK